MSGLLDKLREVYGRHRVVDVFQGTGMEQHKERLGLGAYVVRGALPDEQCATWHTSLEDSLTAIANANGARTVELKSNSPHAVHAHALSIFAPSQISDSGRKASTKHSNLSSSSSSSFQP